jgi:TatA/E family protein of Tat protein translocase
MLGLQPVHLLVIALVALVIFGPRRLPQLGRWIGKTVAEFRRGARDMGDEFRQETARQEAAATASPDAAPGSQSEPAPAPAAPAAAPTVTPARSCPSCGTAAPPTSRFCGECGARLET